MFTDDEMELIRQQLLCMAVSLTHGCNDQVNHGDTVDFNLSDYLTPEQVSWVIGANGGR